MTAARTGVPAAMRVLLDRGARVDARDPEFQQTALMIAAREGHAAAVQLLLERKADPNAQTRKGPCRPSCRRARARAAARKVSASTAAACPTAAGAWRPRAA